jgi:hypothetical protein
MPAGAFATSPSQAPVAAAVPAVTAAPPFARPGRKPGRAANGVIIAFAAVTTLVALHRNGTLFDLSKAVGLSKTYLSFESSVLGPPSILTPRGVELLDPVPSAEPVAGPTAGTP